jgi:Flp pilus assembly protein TadG
VIPLISVSLVVFLAFIGICVDLMRDVETSNQLQYAAQSAALYGLSLGTNSNGTFSTTSAQTNISNAITAVGIAPGSNQSQIGPFQGVWSTPVTFGPGNIQYVPNPNPADPTEFFVQVSAQVVGQNALTQFFLPVLYTNWSTGKTTPSANTVSLTKIVEVLGQPASRVGAGAPIGSQGPNANFVGCGVFPLAISNQQFAPVALAAPNTTPLALTIDLVSSTSSELTGAAPPGHVKGCFVNDSSSGNTNSFYGTATSLADVDQLESLLSYFGGATPQAAVPPTVVERGSALAAYDPASQSFSASQTTLVQALTNIMQSQPAKCYMLPVLYNDPSFTLSANQPNNSVAGFAIARLTAASVTTTGIQVSITLQPSVSMRNASCANGLLTTGNPNNGNSPNMMPAAVAPFLPRQVDVVSGGMTQRPLGVVLAPALSPRQIVIKTVAAS